MNKECEYITHKRENANGPCIYENWSSYGEFSYQQSKSLSTSGAGEGMKKLELPYIVGQSVRLFNILKAICQIY